MTETKIRVVLRKTHKTKNGKYPVCVRVTKPKTVYLQVKGVYMTDKEYNSVFMSNRPTADAIEVRQSYDYFVDRVEKILKVLTPFDEKQLRRLFYDKTYDPTSPKVETEQQSLLLSDLFTYCIDSKLENKKISISTSKHYGYALRKILAFQADVTINDITPDWLSRFEQYFLEHGDENSKSSPRATLGIIIRTLRSVINFNKQRKRIPATYEYPFIEYKVPNYIPPKFVISNEEITRIIECTDFKSSREEYARDVWVMLYRMQGINFVDLLQLMWSDLEGNHYVFERHKTRRTRRHNIRPITIQVTEKIKVSLDKIGDTSSPFVLGLINKTDYDENYLNNINARWKKNINKHLRKIGERLGLSQKLDIAMARDAYANTLKRAGVDAMKIAEKMNHASPKTTLTHYLDSFDQDTLDAVDEHVL
jgi:integrase